MAIEIFVLLFLSIHCGNFIEQIKKVCRMHFKSTPAKKNSLRFGKPAIERNQKLHMGEE